MATPHPDAVLEEPNRASRRAGLDPIKGTPHGQIPYGWGAGIALVLTTGGLQGQLRVGQDVVGKLLAQSLF